jgi:hypothetical protein
MRRLLLAGFLVIGICLAVFRNSASRADQPVTMNVNAPQLEGISEWINTKPLRLEDLQGKVVVLHFWTFG